MHPQEAAPDAAFAQPFAGGGPLAVCPVTRLQSSLPLTLLAVCVLVAGCSGPSPGPGTPTTAPATTQGPGVVCSASPAQTEGPYFVEGEAARSDVRDEGSLPGGANGQDADDAALDDAPQQADLRIARDGVVQKGTALKLTLTVSRLVAGACAPLAGARVDVWHANATGVYSGVAQMGTAGRNFLRGYQVTDPDGKVSFTTIYPGWYPGRAIHIHVKIRTTDGGQTKDFTSQLYFPDAVNDEAMSRSPYVFRGPPSTSNTEDSIYLSGGPRLVVDTSKDGFGYAGVKQLIVT